MTWQDKFKANLLEVLYRPDQPRDELGMWVAAGGSALSVEEQQEADFRTAQGKVAEFQKFYTAMHGDRSVPATEHVPNTAQNAEQLYQDAFSGRAGF